MVGITISGNFSLGRLKYDIIPAKVMIMVKTKMLVLLSILQLEGLNSFS
jgi:hypothetical protein